jgi:hypothetical protein
MTAEIEKSIENSPTDIIPEEILSQFLEVWNLQLSVVNGEEYTKIKLSIIDLLLEIHQGMTYLDIRQHLININVFWYEITNICIVSKLNAIICPDCDFYILVGELHVDSIVENINSTYEGKEELNFGKIRIEDMTKMDDAKDEDLIGYENEEIDVKDIDISDPKYESYWFNDPVFKIVDYKDLNVNEKYFIRFKGFTHNEKVIIKKLYDSKFEYESIMENNITKENNYKNTIFYKY